LAGGGAIALIATALILAVFYLTLPWTSGLALRVYLNKSGWGPARLSVTRFNMRGIEVNNLNLANGAITLAHATLTYNLDELRRGQIGEVMVNGLTVTTTITETDARIGPHPLTFASSGSAIAFRHLSMTDSKIIAVLPQNTITTSLSADLAPMDGRWKGKLTAEASAQNTPLANFKWEGELAWPDVFAATSQGSLDLKADAIALAKDAKLSTHGHVTFATGDGQLTLTAPERLTVNLSSFPTSAEAWTKFLAGGVAVEIGGTKGSPSITWRNEDGLSTAQADVDFKAVAGETSLRGAIHGKMSGAAGELPDVVAIDELNIEGTRVPTPFGDLSGRARVNEVSGSLMTAEGAARLEATLTKPILGPARAETLTFDTDGRFHIDGGTIAFTPQTLKATTANVRVAALSLPGASALTLAPVKNESQSLALVLNAAGEATVTFGITGATHDLRIAGSENVNAATADLPRIRLEGYMTSGRYDVAVRTTGGTLTHPTADFQLNPTSTRFLPNSSDGNGAAQLTRLVGAPPRVSPKPGSIFKYNFHFTNQLIDFTSDISSAKLQALGRIKAQINTADGSGKFELSPAQLRFGDGALAIEDVLTSAFPVSDLSGVVDLSLKTTWGAKTTSSARLAFDNVALQAANVAVSGLAADLYFPSLAPLRSAGPQHVTITTLTAGLPFKDISVETTIPGDGKATLSGSASVAGGKASVSTTSLSLNDPGATAIPLTLSKLNLEPLVNQAQVEGLSATGSISGSLPLRAKNDTIRVENGQVKADGPGRVSYQPKTPPAALAGAGEIVLKALHNFEYDSIAATVNGDLLANLKIGLAMKGRNPDLYGGYPISFNLNLGGPLGNVLRGGVTGYKLDPNALPTAGRNASPGANVNPRQP
jgi:hypothetical protein